MVRRQRKNGKTAKRKRSGGAHAASSVAPIASQIATLYEEIRAAQTEKKPATEIFKKIGQVNRLRADFKEETGTDFVVQGMPKKWTPPPIPIISKMTPSQLLARAARQRLDLPSDIAHMDLEMKNTKLAKNLAKSVQPHKGGRKKRKSKRKSNRKSNKRPKRKTNRRMRREH